MSEKLFDPAVFNQPLPLNQRPRQVKTNRLKRLKKHPWDQKGKSQDKTNPPEIFGGQSYTAIVDDILDTIDNK